jgi:nicotinamidase-related amidase
LGRNIGYIASPSVPQAPGLQAGLNAYDRFFNTNLDDLLRDRQIQTGILAGTAANGAVLYTAAGSTQRAYTVVVADHGMSADDDFRMFLTRYQLLNQPGATNADNRPLQPRATTLSRTDLITFGAPAAGR